MTKPDWHFRGDIERVGDEYTATVLFFGFTDHNNAKRILDWAGRLILANIHQIGEIIPSEKKQ